MNKQSHPTCAQPQVPGNANAKRWPKAWLIQGAPVLGEWNSGHKSGAPPMVHHRHRYMYISIYLSIYLSIYIYIMYIFSTLHTHKYTTCGNPHSLLVVAQGVARISALQIRSNFRNLILAVLAMSVELPPDDCGPEIKMTPSLMTMTHMAKCSTTQALPTPVRKPSRMSDLYLDFCNNQENVCFVFFGPINNKMSLCIFCPFWLCNQTYT